MCVGLPARVVTVRDGMALVDASGAKREVSAELIDQLDPGDYVWSMRELRSQRSLPMRLQRWPWEAGCRIRVRPVAPSSLAPGHAWESGTGPGKVTTGCGAARKNDHTEPFV